MSIDENGDYTSLRRLFAFSQVNERNGDFTTAVAREKLKLRADGGTP